MTPRLIGNLIREALQFRGMTQLELAKRTGFTRIYICYIVNGVTPKLPCTTLAKIAKALDMELQITLTPKDSPCPK